MARASTSIEQECRDVGLGMIWENPWFTPVALIVQYRGDEHATQTACVDLHGVIRINPTYWGQLCRADSQHRACALRKGILAHEMLHLVLRHHERQGPREMRRWNLATDCAINTFIVRGLRYGLPADAVFPPPGHEFATAEELYDLLPPTPPSEAEVAVACGCGVADPSGNGNGKADGQQSAGEAGGEAIVLGHIEPHQWRDIAAQCKAMAIGTSTGDLFIKLTSIPRARVRWAQVLRAGVSRVRAAHGYDDVTYMRRGRRSEAEGPQFPSGVVNSCQVAVVVDSSGSVMESPGAIEQAVAETLAITRAAGVRTYLVVHDWRIQWQGWLSPMVRPSKVAEDVNRGGGGTSFDQAYSAVEAAGRFDALVHLTDGAVGSWPAKPPRVRKLIVALLGLWRSTLLVPKGAKVIETDL